MIEKFHDNFIVLEKLVEKKLGVMNKGIDLVSRQLDLLERLISNIQTGENIDPDVTPKDILIFYQVIKTNYLMLENAANLFKKSYDRVTNAIDDPTRKNIFDNGVMVGKYYNRLYSATKKLNQISEEKDWGIKFNVV